MAYSYASRQGSTGKFTTSYVSKGKFTQNDLTAKMVIKTGLTQEQSAAAFKAAIEIIIDYAKDGIQSEALFGLIEVTPSSGGSSDTPDGFHNAKQINLNVAFNLLKGGVSRLQDGTSIEMVSSSGAVTPSISLIRGGPDLLADIYSATDAIQTQGERIRYNQKDTLQGYFVAPVAGGPAIRCSKGGKNTPTTGNPIIPSGTTGPQRLTLVTKIGASYRTTLYNNIITDT